MKNDVLEYIGLDLDNIPKELKNVEPIHFSDFSNSNTYKVYEYVSVHDLEILITPLDRTADFRERYKLARPIYSYIQAEDTKTKRIFNEVLDSASVKEIQKLEKLQEKLKDIPYFVKYDKNYLWQIYYSKEDNKYFMLFPANEGETSVLFYIIKKKLEKEDTKIFVPINKMDYKGILLNSMQINDIENYIWLFTNEWPNIYEVSNKYLYVTGHTKINKLFNSYYRNVFDNKNDAEKFYMLLKALFILTTETNYKYNFEPYVNENGELELEFNNENSNDFAKNNRKIEEQSNEDEKKVLESKKGFKANKSDSELITVQNLADFVDKQVELQRLRKTDLEEEIVRNEEILKELKEYVKKQNDIYVMQEKQIVMFLDCKKSFFKKISYFFKAKKFIMPKLDNKIDKRLEDELGENSLEDELSRKNEINLNGSYTIKELVSAFNSANEVEIKARAVRADLKALKLKKENYARKIENAKKYIEEIESHKKSIFEFWKFSNKDELPALSEGESSESNETKNNANLDKDLLGARADSLQRQKLSDEEINALYLFYEMPNAFNHISKTYLKMKSDVSEKVEKDRCSENKKIITNEEKNEDAIEEVTEKSTEKNNLLNNNNELLNKNKELKEILENLKNKTSKRSLDNLINDYTAVKKINSKEHRENERNEIAILRINENTTVEEFEDRINHFKKALESAYNKIYAITSMPVYIKKSDAQNEFILADINPENLINENPSKNVKEEKEVNLENESEVEIATDLERIAKKEDSILRNNVSREKDKTDKQGIEIVKIDLGNEEHALYLSNIVFFDNQNKTLPIGMDLSSKVVIKLDNAKKKFREKQEIYLIEKIDDFEVKNRKIKIFE